MKINVGALDGHPNARRFVMSAAAIYLIAKPLLIYVVRVADVVSNVNSYHM